MLKRKTDNSSSMLMFNTIFLGIGAGLVILAWFAQISEINFNSILEPENWSKSDRLLAATLAVLLAGLFHSLVIIYPNHVHNQKERRLAAEKANRLETMAMNDGLTGISNRAYFDAALVAYFEEFDKTAAAFGLFLMDLDNFKSINDTFGHSAGDMVLKKVAEQISILAREYDVIARVGGEEFAILAPYATGADLKSIGERYRKRIENMELNWEGKSLPITISVGIASNQKTDTANQIYLTADKRLYEAKDQGRNLVVS